MILGRDPLGVSALSAGRRASLTFTPTPVDPTVPAGPTYNGQIDYEWRIFDPGHAPPPDPAEVTGAIQTQDNVLGNNGGPWYGYYLFRWGEAHAYGPDTDDWLIYAVVVDDGFGIDPGSDAGWAASAKATHSKFFSSVGVIAPVSGRTYAIWANEGNSIAFGQRDNWQPGAAPEPTSPLGQLMGVGMIYKPSFPHWNDGFTWVVPSADTPPYDANGSFIGRHQPSRHAYYFGEKLWDSATTDADAPGGTLGPVSPPPSPGDWWPHIARSDALVSWAVTGYGRSDSNGRTTPVQVTVVLAAGLAGDCPTVGERFRLQLSDDKAASLVLPEDSEVRFTGEVTDAVIDRRAGTYTITGTGRLGRAQRRTIHPKWPRELDSARATRTLTAAGVEVGTVEAGIVDVLPQLADVNVGQHLDLLAESAGGQVVEQLTGEVDYQSADHRRGAVVALTLTPAEILNDLTWAQHVGDVLNELEVTYGNPAATISVSDPDSVDALDSYPGSLSTMLVDASDAHSLASLVLARRRDPVWQLPALTVDLRRTVTTPQLRKLLALRAGDRMRIADLPGVGPYVGTVDVFVEGLAEVATRTTWRLSIAVSDPRLSGVGIRWKDAPAGLTWAQVDPALTWLDVGTLEDPAALD